MDRLMGVVAAAVVALSGCATGGVTSPNADVLNKGKVAGVLALPAEVAAAQPCDKIRAVAKVGDAQVGRAAVRQSRGRCAYEITNLPEETELTVQLEADGVSCPSGGALAIENGAGPLKIKKGQLLMHDVQSQCS